ncbi:MAG: transporter, partial [Planctomycetota bacterium]
MWTTSLMFFQGALFLAYAYAHLLAPRLGVAHLGLVALALVQLPPGIDGGGEGLGPLLMALAGVLLPFVALTSASVVTQRWTLAAPGGPGSAYGLYAWSNAGSLGALLLYVLVVERFVPLGAQRLGWSVLYVAHLAVAVWAARELRPGREPPGRVVRPRLGVLGAWVLLAAAPSALSMAVTNLLALEAGNLPLVWVPPLALYLGSFVVAFAEPGKGERSRVPRAVRRLWPHV